MRALLETPYRVGSRSGFFSRTISSVVKQFGILGPSDCKGTLIKFTFTPGHQNVLGDINKLISQHRNSLFIWMIPSLRIEKLYESRFNPGHVFSSMTDNSGATVCWMSKRPNKKELLETRIRIEDKRFLSKSKEVSVYAPRYTSISEEIETWLKGARASTQASAFPLYVHIIPIVPGLPLTAQNYMDNVEIIKELNAPYVLHGSRRKEDLSFLIAQNCINATAGAFYGHLNYQLHLQDMFCQEALQHLVLPLVPDSSVYLDFAEASGLNEGIEHSTIELEKYGGCFLG